MSVNKKPLVHLYHEIRESIIGKLKDSENLKEVKEFVYGERARAGSLKSPSIWIVPEPHVPDLIGGRTAQHDITFNFVALVKDNMPQEGLKKAERLSMTVYDILVEERSSRGFLNGLVSDIRPTRVDPAYDAGNNTQLYWSAVQFAFRLQRKE